MTPIELLSPAKDLECGKAAIDHGADAVYIGGPAFGARGAAGNPMKDIETLARHAHRFWSKVYLTLNTILFDGELEEARGIARQAWDAGVDALIIQDPGLLEINLPPLPLIASTQMHNAELSRISFLEKVGFSRVILARELSLEEIREVRDGTSIELEAFVHGALCVGYSGQCYLSASLGGRSANRGTCGQPCRLAWNLLDAKGRVLEENRHLLSLKDLDRSAHLSGLIAAGVTAFKIEGRLKDVSYVKNVTAYYRGLLDRVISDHPGIARASSGGTETAFTPDPRKTFSRGATDFFLHGADDGMWLPDTPKATGEEMGTVVQCGQTWFTLDQGADGMNAGDGLCFFSSSRELRGMQVVKVVDGRVQVHMPIEGLEHGMKVFRNRDHQFLKALSGETSVRRIGLGLAFRETGEGFVLKGTDDDGVTAEVFFEGDKEPAAKPEASLESLKKQLSKLGESIFSLRSLHLDTMPYFFRVSELNQLRRDLITVLEDNRGIARPRMPRPAGTDDLAPCRAAELDYRFNVANKAAASFYKKHGALTIEPAFELKKPGPDAVVMVTKHCLRRCLDACLKDRPDAPLEEPLYLEHAGKRFRLAFDCRACCMKIVLISP
jgi:23S rRNA 5-hydroxycytidine C2501 synthase